MRTPSLVDRLASSDVLSLDVSIGIAAIAVALVGGPILQTMRSAARGLGDESLTGKEVLQKADHLRWGLLALLIGGSITIAAAVASSVFELWVLGAVATLAALAVVAAGLFLGVPLLSDPERRHPRRG